LIKCNEPQCIFACSAISVQPVNDAKLNPFNADWSTEYFKSCDPIQDGNFDNIRFEIVCVVLGILYCLFGSCCAGRLHGRAGEHFCTCLVPGATQALRTKVRMAYGIRVSLYLFFESIIIFIIV